MPSPVARLLRIVLSTAAGLAASALLAAACASAPARTVVVPADKPDLLARLLAAARLGDEPGVKAALKDGAPVNGVKADGRSALSWAATSRSLATATTLLLAGAAVDLADAAGWTPLMHAARAAEARMCRHLLENGASARARAADGTSVTDAARAGGSRNVQVLVEYAAERGVRKMDPDSNDKPGTDW